MTLTIFSHVTMMKSPCQFLGPHCWSGAVGCLCIDPIDKLAFGYVTEAGNFVVVDNMHHLASRISATLLGWEPGVYKCWEVLDGAPAEDIVSEGGTCTIGDGKAIPCSKCVLTVTYFIVIYFVFYLI